MNRKLTKKVVSSLISAAMLATNTAFVTVPMMTGNADFIVNSDFDDEVGLPWRCVTEAPAKQVNEMDNGAYRIKIIDNEGPSSRWDLQLRNGDINLTAGHVYRVSFDIDSTSDGEIFTAITERSMTGEAWVNGLPGVQAYQYPGIEDTNGYAHSTNAGNLIVKKGSNHYESFFIAENDLHSGYWSFQYGGKGEYQMTDCFPNGTVLEFDNLILEDVTGDEKVKVRIPKPKAEEIHGTSIIGMGDFDDEIALPWHPVQEDPARQSFELADGAFKTTIINSYYGNLQFRHRGLHIEAGHEYKIAFDLNSTSDGNIYTAVQKYNGEDLQWLNGLEGTQAWNYAGMEDPQGNMHALSLSNLVIKKGDNHFEGTFTARDTLEQAEWMFYYGNYIDFQENACFPDGTVLSFDNMVLEDITGTSIPCGDIDYGFRFPQSNVRINQEGYFTDLSKKASYVTDNKEPVKFEVRDKDGNAVFSGVSKLFGEDRESGIGKADEHLNKDSGQYVHILDFSELKETGEFTIFVEDSVGVSGTKFRTHEGYFDTKEEKGELIWSNGNFTQYVMNQSSPFTISANPYSGGITKDALNYFYQNRSGIDIEADKITSGNAAELAHAAAHKQDAAYVQPEWVKYYIPDGSNLSKKYQIDVTGGWYDGDMYVKSVTEGASAAWLLQNAYESAMKKNGKADKDAVDALEEARYEIEWLLKMRVQFDDPVWGEYEGMVYNEVRDSKWISPGTKSWDYINEYDGIQRILKPPTYAATMDFAAVTAQAARLWKDKDPDFAEECLKASKKAYEVFMSRKDKWLDKDSRINEDDPFYAPRDTYYGTGNTYDTDVNDEAYWAGSELFITTGDKAYAELIKDTAAGDAYSFANSIPGEDGAVTNTLSSFDSRKVAAFGNMSMLLNADKLTDEQSASLKKTLAKAADAFLDAEYEQGMGVPFRSVSSIDIVSIGMPGDYSFEGYAYGSNGYIVNNALLLAKAYEATGEEKYLSGAAEAMDYIFGRNGNGLSYVTGYGDNSVKNPYHSWWAKSIDPSFPSAPSGVLVGGPSAVLADNVSGLLGMKRGGSAAQKSYIDNAEAFSSNSTSISWNASLVNVLSYFGTKYNGEPEVVPTTMDPTAESKNYYGDANCDGKVTLADALAVLQFVANADKYPLSEQGQKNADCVDAGKGITAMDSVAIQMIDTQQMPEDALPVTTEKLGEFMK